METLILFGKIIAMSLLIALVCLGSFYWGWKMVDTFIGDK